MSIVSRVKNFFLLSKREQMKGPFVNGFNVLRNFIILVYEVANLFRKKLNEREKLRFE